MAASSNPAAKLDGSKLPEDLEKILARAADAIGERDYLAAAQAYRKAAEATLAMAPARAPVVSDADEQRVGLALDAIAGKLKEGKCILFLGAGAHYPPPEGSRYSYAEADRPPLGGSLSEELAVECNFASEFPRDSSRNLQRVSLYFEKQLSRKRLVDRIVQRVDDNGKKKPSPALRALAEMNFPLVMTTNYDQLFEQALRRAGKNPRVMVYDPDPNCETGDFADYSVERPFVFKIHGDVEKPESVVITDEDYIHFLLRMSDRAQFHPVPETFLFHMKRWPTLFVGYSLLDYNLRLLLKTLRWRQDASRRPDNYSVDKFPDLLIRRVYADQHQLMQFIPLDVWKFVPELYQRVMGKEMPA